MDKEDNWPTVKDENLGIYDTLKKLSQKYAQKVPSCDKRFVNKIFYKNYDILLRKVEGNFIAVPSDLTDEDLLNTLYLQICEYKNVKELWKKFETLYKQQHTEVYQTSIAPVIKMLYSITINESRNKKRKNYSRQEKVWFDTDYISKYLNNSRKYLPHQDIKFFTFPKIQCSQSEGNLALFRSVRLPFSLTENCVMRHDKLSYDLDEGFVTPNDEHKEKSPFIERKTIIPAKEHVKFDWDFNVVNVPPSKNKTWEKFDLLGRDPEHHFVQKQINLQHWLSKAPLAFTKISGKQLFEDIMSLLIGIPSTTFVQSAAGTFQLKDGIYTDDFSTEDILDMTKEYIEVAEAFLALTNLSQNPSNGDTITCAFKLALKQYLYNYQLMVFEIINRKDNNEAYVCDMDLLIKQIIYMKKLLVHSEELKGVALLEKLYMNIENSCIQKFYVVTSLFLLPCVYYFRLIDEWIFLGRWHKDLPITPCDINLIKDRQSWEEAYKPIQSDIPWFIPVQDLAYCGKALSLLSLSKNSEKFLSMLKLGDRPRVKLCLQLEELKELEKECQNYYERVKKTFKSDKLETLDFILCSQNSAKMQALAFEELKKREKIAELERKKNELHLREQDLIRSAKVKQNKKQEEELDNIRVAEEMEEILLKENQQELKKVKEIYKLLKEEHIKDEKTELRADFNFKRQQNNKKRQDFLNNELCIVENTAYNDEDHSEGVTVVKKLESVQNKNYDEVTIEVPNKANEEKFTENKIFSSIKNDGCNKGIECDNMKATYSDLERNRLKVLGSNIGERQQISKSELDTKLEDGQQMSKSELGSNLGEGQQISKSELGSNLGGQQISKSEIGNDKSETKEQSDSRTTKNKGVNRDELERNRLKSLYSDFGRGNEIMITFGQAEAEQNKKRMLGTHFILGTDPIDEKVNNNIEISETKDEYNNKVIDENNTLLETSGSLNLENVSQANINKDNSCFNIDQQHTEKSDICDINKADDQPESVTEQVTNTTKLFDKNNKYVEGVKHLFKANNQILLPEQSLDYCSVLRVPVSLKLVLETQVKLVNEALVEMFLNEFKLLAEAGMLKKYFFLGEKFGKKLTASLCLAIEKEKPSTLLTFGKLGDILMDASLGDEKVSFIVKETPVAFEHTNPQVLSCLGMSYKFNWPLNLIFTDIAVSKYNEVFEFMLSLKRVTWHLEQVWAALKFKSSQMKGHEYTQIQLYRHVMYQFVSTLQWYISTNVFENCWQKFNRDVMEVTNPQELYKKHAAYIKEVIFKCFLNERSSSLMTKIQSLLKYILTFCQVLRFGEWSISVAGEYQHCNFTKLQCTFSCFLKIARFVIRQIEKLVKVNYQDGLANLYNLFTLNSFYLA